MHPVTVQFLKNPDIIHWGFETHRLGEDEWGTWIGVPTGTKRWKGERAVRPTPVAAVFLAPREQWWHLHYTGATTEFSHFVDIATPPVWVNENRYEMIDLDLDVVRRQDGVVEIEDEDEFEIHQVRYGYTEEMITRAVEETARVADMLRGHQEPFFAVAQAWLDRLSHHPIQPGCYSNG
jgi:protein associated with RNAse G/E